VRGRFAEGEPGGYHDGGYVEHESLRVRAVGDVHRHAERNLSGGGYPIPPGTTLLRINIVLAESTTPRQRECAFERLETMPSLAKTRHVPCRGLSEIIVFVNTTEKVTLLKFSIRSFGSVSGLGSQYLRNSADGQAQFLSLRSDGSGVGKLETGEVGLRHRVLGYRRPARSAT
jgi:hypothetical protein